MGELPPDYDGITTSGLAASKDARSKQMQQNSPAILSILTRFTVRPRPRSIELPATLCSRVAYGGSSCSSAYPKATGLRAAAIAQPVYSQYGGGIYSSAYL